MTSEEISALRQKFELDTSMQSDLMRASALLEIAYQLAVMNERSQKFTCETCGGPRRSDQAVCDDCFSKMRRTA